MVKVTFIDKCLGEVWTATYTVGEYAKVKPMIENDPMIIVYKVEIE